MREIKFRAWNGEAISEPFYPWELISNKCGGLIDKKGFSVWWNHPDYTGKNWMQFTGLRDKNGNEIYEGDIVKSGNGRLWEVKFGSFSYTNQRQEQNGFGYYLCPVEDPFRQNGNIYLYDQVAKIALAHTAKESKKKPVKRKVKV